MFLVPTGRTTGACSYIRSGDAVPRPTQRGRTHRPRSQVVGWDRSAPGTPNEASDCLVPRNNARTPAGRRPAAVLPLIEARHAGGDDARPAQTHCDGSRTTRARPCRQATRPWRCRGDPVGRPWRVVAQVSRPRSHRRGKLSLLTPLFSLLHWGRDHIAAENSRSSLLTSLFSLLHWCRDHIAAENSHSSLLSSLFSLLQWGRSTSLRKTWSPTRCSWRARWLQWGRDRIAAENSHSSPLTSLFSLLQWGRSTSLRKTNPHDPRIWSRLALQWGRSTSLRKTNPHDPRIWSRLALQWGRSTSLRKTSYPDTDRVLSLRFNGAAAHRCGKPTLHQRQRTEYHGFNGAAAHRCGKRDDALMPVSDGDIRASMGPQHIAAEN